MNEDEAKIRKYWENSLSRIRAYVKNSTGPRFGRLLERIAHDGFITQFQLKKDIDRFGCSDLREELTELVLRELEQRIDAVGPAQVRNEWDRARRYLNPLGKQEPILGFRSEEIHEVWKALPIWLLIAIDHRVERIPVGILPERSQKKIVVFQAAKKGKSLETIARTMSSGRASELIWDLEQCGRPDDPTMKRLAGWADKILTLTIKRELREEEELKRLRKEETRRRDEAGRLRAEREERVAKRARQIVQVFNGVFDCEVDPDAVMTGDIGGSYASIHAPPGMGMGMQLLMTQRLELTMCSPDQTWLEIEEGLTEEECEATYASANFLVWHELGHLVDPSVFWQIFEGLDSDRLALIHQNEATAAQAREVVVDAIGLRLGEDLYVHPDEGRLIKSSAVRCRMMVESHLFLVKRIVTRFRQLGKVPAEDEPLLVRLMAEVQAHRGFVLDFDPKPTLAKFRYSWPYIAKQTALRAAYRRLYELAASTDVLELTFHSHLPEEEEQPVERLVGK